MGPESNKVIVPDAAKFVTLAQLCAARQCSPSTIRRRVKDGTIPFVKFGALIRFPRELLGERVAADRQSAGGVVRAGKTVEARG